MDESKERIEELELEIVNLKLVIVDQNAVITHLQSMVKRLSGENEELYKLLGVETS